MNDAQQRLAQSWNDVAEGYEQYFVPRFAPWVADAVAPLEAELPPGPVLIPCCGTFPELPALRAAQPGRELRGLDLSPGMIELARGRAADDPQVLLAVGDAVDVEPAANAAVVSVFGLQQLPDPAVALGRWVSSLLPGGLLSVMFWPPQLDTDGPFTTFRAVLGRPAPPPWPEQLAAAVESAGGVLERDVEVVHPMSHPDAGTFFAAMTTGGSGHATTSTMSAEQVADLRERFLERAPRGEWSHTPQARHLLVRRR